ncbi:hypothetical protein [Paraclostridium sordellii]|uniref:hypothetical protein n=1 Tax=Paraclostridium sordellii TaxID=1505 RepID=UPI0003869519|nr:hypothetical protein [Paeniclostridium sordellii]EPZ57556.1 hypothetical protein H476_1039 [[Clostridium] sordellii VPI 9048] [Paeniclostridium sordellii VPI 9048]CEK39996.1 hypothetical protein JGS6382_33241 [[Clostridium] sordellii] [Paeniclostridium sordellii]
MSSLFVKNLYIFECTNKLAKKVEFKYGINIITSDSEKGNSVGKSSILRSIYHTLGADGEFNSEWASTSKTYLLEFEIDNNTYYIYRRDSLFKIFDKDFNRLYSTINRSELSWYLSNIFDFKVMLKNREDELEIAPPAYSYLLNYIDQDKMNGADFCSFKSLTQFPYFRSTLLYTHFGIYNDEYYKAQSDIVTLKSEIKRCESEKKLVNLLKEKLNAYLKGYNAPNNIEILNIELDENDNEYEKIITKLQKTKNLLINLRNTRLELKESIKEIEDLEKDWNQKLLDTDIDINEKIEKTMTLEELIIEKDEIDSEILRCDRKIESCEEDYKKILESLKRYENKLKLNESHVDDILKYKGYQNTRNELIIEFAELSNVVDRCKEKIKESKSIINSYNNKKSKIKKRYYELMKNSKEYFDIKEVHNDSFKSIDTKFRGEGGNLPASTVFWHVNLLKLKYEFNRDSIRFPLIIDSPNNREIEGNKKVLIFKYIFENNISDTQIIVSSLGFDKSKFKDVKFDNLIELNNEKYNLLNRHDYEENKHILKMIIEN